MVNIIIVTYNGLKWIERCLSSLSGEAIISKIIVVDNGSTDGTIEYIKKNYPCVKLILNNTNYGFGHSNNQAISLSLKDQVEYVFLLNQDAWIEKGGLERLVAAHKNNPQYGIISPIHLNGKGDALDMKYAFFVAQSENYQLISDLYLHRNEMAEVYSVNFINAAAWLVTRKCIEVVGGFAPVYHHYGEDMDYAARVLYHDLKIGICPSCVIYHDRKNVIELPDVNKPKQYLKLKKIWHLIYLTNINYSFMPRFIKLMAIVGERCFNSIFHFKWRNTVTYLKEVAILIVLFPKVISNNIRSRKQGANFL